MRAKKIKVAVYQLGHRRDQMTSLQLPTETAQWQAAANGAAAGNAADARAEVLSVTIDVAEPAIGPDPLEGLVYGPEPLESCASEMSFCDLADSVAPSDSVSQVVSPKNSCHNFDRLHAMLTPVDDAYATWKQQCLAEEAAAVERLEHESLVQMLLQQHAAEPGKDAGVDKGIRDDMRKLMQSVSSIERSVANLHLHFGTAFPPSRSSHERRPNVLQTSAFAADMQQAFPCNTNINAPNMNRQHATGGRGRGRRHAQAN
jgi:hypothetical protein